MRRRGHCMCADAVDDKSLKILFCIHNSNIIKKKLYQPNNNNVSTVREFQFNVTQHQLFNLISIDFFYSNVIFAHITHYTHIFKLLFLSFFELIIENKLNNFTPHLHIRHGTINHGNFHLHTIFNKFTLYYAYVTLILS